MTSTGRRHYCTFVLRSEAHQEEEKKNQKHKKLLLITFTNIYQQWTSRRRLFFSVIVWIKCIKTWNKIIRRQSIALIRDIRSICTSLLSRFIYENRCTFSTYHNYMTSNQNKIETWMTLQYKSVIWLRMHVSCFLHFYESFDL